MIPSRHAAILMMDLVGYSRLMGLDETGTLARLKALRTELVNPLIAAHGGRLVKLLGDGALTEFADPGSAAACALQIQRGMQERGQHEADGLRLHWRIGINFDAVHPDGDDLYGDGVNVAARLEGMAEPGGILISESVLEALPESARDGFFDNGPRRFKNIVRAVRVWSWPRKLPSLRGQTKPLVFIEPTADGGGERGALSVAMVAQEVQMHLGRLTGLALAGDRAHAHYALALRVVAGAGRARVYSTVHSIESGQPIWSNRIEPPSGDALEMLDHCAPRIAMGVRRAVATDDAQRLARVPLDELSFEEVLSLGGATFFQPTMAGWRGGGELAEVALGLQPANPMALAMAAAGLGLAESLYGWRTPDPAVIALALNRAREALRALNRSDMLHAAHAGLHLYGMRQWADARAAANRSLQVNPDYNMGLWMLAATETFDGQPLHGLELADRAVDIEPRDPYVHLYRRVGAYACMAMDRHAEAAQRFLETDQMAPDLAPNLIGLATALHFSGDMAGAQRTVLRLREVEPSLTPDEVGPLPDRDGRLSERVRLALRQAWLA